MTKIAIITMHYVKNYGSALQTYATQCIFQNRGYETSIIDFRRQWDAGLRYYYSPQKNIKDYIKQLVFIPTKIKQKKVFERFLFRRIVKTERSFTSNEITEDLIPADIYCTGSDQVWNSGWNRGIIEEYFLNFVKSSKMKVAYASSIGNTSISDSEMIAMKKLLSSYSLISVREKSSISFLESIGINDTYCVLDPTLQLHKNDWESLIEGRPIKDNNYVLLIQLNRNKGFDNFAVSFAHEKGKKLIRLCLRLDQIILPGKHLIIPEVEDYLSYISHADYVLTDSFHAVSFSLNFEKQFYCIMPPDYSNRLTSILEQLNLEDRIIHNYHIDKLQEKTIDYLSVNERVEKLRIHSDKFLNSIAEEYNKSKS